MKGVTRFKSYCDFFSELENKMDEAEEICDVEERQKGARWDWSDLES